LTLSFGGGYLLVESSLASREGDDVVAPAPQDPEVRPSYSPVKYYDPCGPGAKAGEIAESIQQASRLLPEEFAAEAFPTPFERSTSVRVALPGDSGVEVSVFDLTGRQVYQIAAEMTAGSSVVRLFLDGLAQGVYLYRVRSAFGVRSGKIVKLR